MGRYKFVLYHMLAVVLVLSSIDWVEAESDDVSKLTMEIILQFAFFAILTASKTSALSPL